MPSSPFDLRIKTIGGTDVGYMLWKDRSGRRTYSVQDASTISPRFLTEEQITQSQLPADIALTFPQTNWRRGIGGIRFEAKDPDVLADGAQVDVTEQGVLKLARETAASAVKSGDNPNEYVPSGFAVSGTQLWAFIGRDAYSWDFTDKEWDIQTEPFAAARIYRNGVNFSGNIYAPAWSDDAGSSGSYTADDEPVSYLYKTPTADQWSKVTTAAQTLDGCKYMAIAGQSLWGGYWADSPDSTINLEGPQFNAVSSGGFDSAAGTLTVAHETVGNNRLILVTVASYRAAGSQQPSGVTYNSISLTKIAQADAAVSGLAISMWYLVAPATGDNYDAIVSWSPNVDKASVGVMSFTGVDQSTPVNTTDTNTLTTTSTSPNISETYGTGELIVSGLSFYHGGGAAADEGTERWDVAQTSFGGTGSTLRADGTAQNIGYTITSSVLAQAVTSLFAVTHGSAVTVLPTTGTPESQFDDGDVIRIESELMLVTDVTNTPPELTVVRGYRGSVAVAHPNNTDIYKVTENPHQVRSTADGTAMANWSTETSVGDSGSPITALVGVGDDLIVIKTDGIYRLEADGTVTNLRPELAAFGHNDFGKGAWAWNDLVFIPLHGGGLWELDTTNWAIRDISFSVTMPDQTQYHGRVVAGHGEPNRLYVMVLEDFSVTGNRQYDILMTENPATAGINDYNWTMVGSITYATATDANHAALLLEAITNGTDEHHRLWAGVESTATSGTGSNLLPYFITHDAHDDDDEYSSTNGEAKTVAFDAGFPNVLKRAQDIVCNTDNLGAAGGSNHIIEVRYRLEGTGNWLYVNSGTTSNTGNNSTLVGDNQTIAFSQGVTFYKIELRFTLDRKGTGDATTPELHDFALTCQLRPSAVKLLPLSFYLANGIALNNGMVENKAKTKRDQLRTWDTQGAEVVVTDTEGGTRNCVMLPGQMKETEVRNGYHQFPEYKCDVVFAEVG